MKRNKVHECAEELLRILPNPKDVDRLADELYEKVYGKKPMKPKPKAKCISCRHELPEDRIGRTPFCRLCCLKITAETLREMESFNNARRFAGISRGLDEIRML